MKVLRLGNDDVLREHPEAFCVLGIGAVKVSNEREKIVDRLALPRSRWGIVVHPSSVVSETAKLGPGVVVLPGAVICSGAHISEHCIINMGAKIDHDVHVGKFVHVAPQAALGGGCRVEDHSYIGMGAMIRDHVTVSSHTLVGMSAAVGKQFPPGKTLIGIPAKEMAS